MRRKLIGVIVVLVAFITVRTVMEVNALCRVSVLRDLCSMLLL